MDIATRSAMQEITEAGKFLRWLREEHGTVADGLQQAHVDEYLAEGTSARKHIRNFVHWLRPGRPRRRTEALIRRGATEGGTFPAKADAYFRLDRVDGRRDFAAGFGIAIALDESARLTLASGSSRTCPQTSCPGRRTTTAASLSLP